MFSFSHWAQPVTSKRWAIICTVQSFLYFKVSKRLCGVAKHRSWERACGIGRA